MHREGRQEDDTIVRVAATLGLDLDKAYGLAGVTAPEAKPYTPPAEAHRLNERQRKAIDELIRATVADLHEQEAGDGSERSATSMNRAEGNSANEPGVTRVDFTMPERGISIGYDADEMAADKTGETEKERQDREAAKLGEYDQSGPGDY